MISKFRITVDQSYTRAIRSGITLGLLVLLISGCTNQLSAQFGIRVQRETISEFRDFEISKSEVVRPFRDTIPDSLKPEKKHSPKTASILSACLPGAGQIYNKKAWKLAIIYPALGGLGFGIGWNHHYFKYYRDALRARYDDDPNTIDPMPLYSDDRLVTTKNYYQRNRDLCVIGFAAVYLLQIIDAAVDAHLFYFDVGPDLSMRWSPVLLEGQTPAPGISFGFSLR